MLKPKSLQLEGTINTNNSKILLCTIDANNAMAEIETNEQQACELQAKLQEARQRLQQIQNTAAEENETMKQYEKELNKHFASDEIDAEDAQTRARLQQLTHEEQQLKQTCQSHYDSLRAKEASTQQLLQQESELKRERDAIQLWIQTEQVNLQVWQPLRFECV